MRLDLFSTFVVLAWCLLFTTEAGAQRIMTEAEIRDLLVGKRVLLTNGTMEFATNGTVITRINTGQVSRGDYVISGNTLCRDYGANGGKKCYRVEQNAKNFALVDTRNYRTTFTTDRAPSIQAPASVVPPIVTAKPNNDATKDLPAPNPPSNSSTASDIPPGPIPNQTAAAGTHPVIAKTFFAAGGDKLGKYELAGTVIVSRYALQPWKGEHEGGEALFEFSSSNSVWALKTMGGGAADAAALIALGVPNNIARQLVAGKSQAQGAQRIGPAARASVELAQQNPSLGTPLYAGPVRVIYDPETKCGVRAPNSLKATAIRWSGKCNNNFIDGVGDLKWYEGDTLVWEEPFGEGRGQIAQEGDLRVLIEPKDYKLTLKECSSSISYRYVWVEIADTLNIASKAVATQLLKAVADFAHARCPKATKGNISVSVVRTGKPTLDDVVLHARSNDGELLQWGEWDNRAAREIEAKVFRFNEQVAARKQAEQEREKAEAERRQVQAVSDERRRRRSELTSQYKVEQFVGSSELEANPFVYKDKVVAIPATFVKMISENEALFNNVLVGNAPPTQFRAASPPFMLVLRVRGTRALKSGLNEATVPYGDFVGAAACSDYTCPEFLEQQ